MILAISSFKGSWKVKILLIISSFTIMSNGKQNEWVEWTEFLRSKMRYSDV
jgi:hypothetical protein